MQSRNTGGNGAEHDGRLHGGTPGDRTERMRQAVAAVIQGTGTHGELATAAHELVTELRRGQAPPEQMLLKIKEILGESGLRPTYATDSPAPVATHATLYRDVISWSIRYYYEDGDGK